MPKKKAPVDFVKWLQSQLKAFRARRFEQLDVEVLGDELESVVEKYRYEVRDRAERLISILMRREYVYGDWNDLRFEWNMVRSALKMGVTVGGQKIEGDDSVNTVRCN